MSECEHGKCEGYCPQCGDLRKFARDASDGPYTVDLGDDGYEIESPSERLPYDYQDALFMAACTPERIVGLLDELAARDETIATLRRLCTGESAAFLEGMGTMAEATGSELEEARRAWAKANAECCELKAQAERMTNAPTGCHVAGCEGDAMVWLGCCYAHDRERDELTEANRRIAAALEFAGKWGEGHAGWAAILRGEDG